MASDVITRVITRVVASIWKHPKTQYWTACFRDASGHQRRASTKETNRKRAQSIADEYEKAYRTNRTLKQMQAVLDRLHEELSGEHVVRATVRSSGHPCRSIPISDETHCKILL